MPRATFHYRFVVCRSFFEEAMKNGDGTPKALLFQSLMFISINSKEHKKCHNLMSKKIRDNLIATNTHMKPEYIKASLNQISEPDSIEAISDEVIRNIKYAIEISEANEEKIQNVCILVGESKKQDYLSSSHLEGITHVTVKSSVEAEQLIDQYKLQCWDR